MVAGTGLHPADARPGLGLPAPAAGQHVVHLPAVRPGHRPGRAARLAQRPGGHQRLVRTPQRGGVADLAVHRRPQAAPAVALAGLDRCLAAGRTSPARLYPRPYPGRAFPVRPGLGAGLAGRGDPRAHRSGAGQRHPGQPRRRRRPPALRRIRRGGTQRRHRLSLRHRRPAADRSGRRPARGGRPQRPGLAAARRALGDSARPAGGLLPGPWSRPPGHPPAGAAHRHLGVGQRLPRPGADRAVLCRRRRTGRLGLPRQLRRRDRPAPRRGGDAGARLGTGRGAGGRRRRARGRAGQRRHRVRRRPQRTPEGGGRRGDARRALLRQPAGALAGSAAGDPARRHALPSTGTGARCRWRCCCSACAGRRWSGCWSAGG